jgi:GPI mannosyltransferase 3
MIDRELSAILLFSLSVRASVIILLPSLHHPDENFQLFEQAHRLAFGYGISPWEFRDGIRSLVVPAVLSKIFGGASIVSDNPEVYIDAARIGLAIFSLFAVAALYHYGQTKSKAHALIPSIVLAVWFEAVYFSIRPLGESLAATCLVCAVCFGLLARENRRQRNLLLAGFFASLAVMFRIHIGIGALVLAIWVCRFDVRHKWLPFIIGALPPLAVFGIADWIVWGAPFSSFIKYFKINLIEGKSAHYGVSPFWWYFQQILLGWAGFLPAIAFLIYYKIRSNLLWVLIGGAIIGSHSFIAHKEYRFIYPALLCIIIAAALGSADLCQRLAKAFPEQKRQILAIIVLFWSTTSAALAVSPDFYDNWFELRESIKSFYFLNTRDDMCGLLLYDTGWWDTGGYAHLHRNVPIYDNEHDDFDIAKVTPLANYVAVPEGSVEELPKQYKMVRCFTKVDKSKACIFSRPGSCKMRNDVIPLARQSGLGEE